MARSVCEGCLRPESVCLCDALVRMASPLELMIWQDPDEARHRLSTAPLLNLSVTNSVLNVGDQFDPHELLGENWRQETLLLFPLENKPPVSRGNVPHFRRLLVLDGTWRKVKRLLLLNPWLQELAHIQLVPEQQSRYAIRKSPRADGLSTLEAGVEAMNWLSDSQAYAPMLRVLDRMVEIQQSHQPVSAHRR